MFKQDDLKTKNFRRQALAMTAVAMVIVYILWNIPVLDFILYPLRLFTTYVHEAFHALAALATGGRVASFSVSFDTSGVTRTAGGWRWLILPAGYLGAGLFGSSLFFLVNRFPRLTNSLAASLGIGMALFSVFFSGGDFLALLIGVGMGMILLGVGLKAHPLITMLILNVFAITTALNAFFDLQYIIFRTDASNGDVLNDVSAFSRDITPFIPPSVLAVTWAGIAVIMLAMALFYGVWKPLHREIEESYSEVISKR